MTCHPLPIKEVSFICFARLELLLPRVFWLGRLATIPAKQIFDGLLVKWSSAGVRKLAAAAKMSLDTVLVRTAMRHPGWTIEQGFETLESVGHGVEFVRAGGGLESSSAPFPH